MIILNVGPNTELNVFQIEGNDQAQQQRPMSGRGRLDHIGFQTRFGTASARVADRAEVAAAFLPADG